MSQPWRNRIVGSGVKPAADFLANELNWRLHPKHQQDALAGVLSEVGWVQEVVENVRTGRVIDGHLRITLALRQGDETPVPYKQVDLSEEEEALILATLDPLAALATTDAAKLDELLREVQTGDAAVQQMLSELAESAGLYKTPQEQEAGPVTIPEQWMVVIECETEHQQVELFQRLSDEGYACRLLVS